MNLNDINDFAAKLTAPMPDKSAKAAADMLCSTIGLLVCASRLDSPDINAVGGLSALRSDAARGVILMVNLADKLGIKDLDKAIEEEMNISNNGHLLQSPPVEGGCASADRQEEAIPAETISAPPSSPVLDKAGDPPAPPKSVTLDEFKEKMVAAMDSATIKDDLDMVWHKIVRSKELDGKTKAELQKHFDRNKKRFAK